MKNSFQAVRTKLYLILLHRRRATALNFRDNKKKSMEILFLAFDRSGMLGGFLGEAMYRYSYDIQSGTSHYRQFDGTEVSWTTPEKKGNGI